MSDSSDRLLIARGENDRLFDEAGRAYIDLFSAHGTAWLGHANPAVGEAISAQLRQVWNTGAIPTRIREQAQAAVESLFPPSHRLAGFYSTGMEAAEFALRMARIVTGRPRIVGFKHAMHGKSLATAALSWDNHWNLRSSDLVRLPFVDQQGEDHVLSALKAYLIARDVAAVCVEPLLGSHGGYQASKSYYRSLQQVCAEYGTLLIFDEILTGFWRTGWQFFFSDLGFTPDVVLIGKALGAGFPVSGVVVDRRLEVSPGMLPSSTFAGNPLAAAAVVAALAEMARHDLPARVSAIGDVIERHLSPLRQFGMALRGCGALWVLEMTGDIDLDRLLADVYRGGVAIGNAGRFVRLLPAATISPENLEQACGVLFEAIMRQVAAQAGKHEARPPKLLFVLSQDYGELFNALYFVAGAPFSSAFALPPRLHQANERTLPVPAFAYRSGDDISDIVARERPDLIVLFSGYLFVINKLLSQDELALLLEAWRSQGQRIVTSDPSLGLIAGGSAGMFQEQFPGATALGPHFHWLAEQFANAFHVYLAPQGIATTRRHGSYFNPRHVLDAVEFARRSAMLATWSAIDRARRRWLFVLSPEDDALQAAALGRAVFATRIVERLRDAENAGRQAVLIAPAACLAAVRETGLAPTGFIGLSACGYLRFMLLLYDAEYVFYWNLFSASMLARVINQQPIFTFAAGHLVHALRRIRALGAQHFYLGEEPTSLKLHAPLEAEPLAGLAATQQLQLLAPVSGYLAQSPTPEQLVATILEGRAGV